MKVLHTIAGLSSLSGGPSTCTRDLLDGLSKFESSQVDLLTMANPQNPNLGCGSLWLKEVENDCITPLQISANLRKALEESDYDLYHSNALWMYVNHITCKIARYKGKPYVLSPHGMLYPTALGIKSWKKKPMLWVWFNKDIHKASCLHATCAQEMNYCREFGYKGPIAVIPNPVVIPEYIKPKEYVPEHRKIGFIGRLHPIKRVEVLIYACAKAFENGCPAFSVEIMGSGDKEYEQFLKAEVERLGLNKVVNFVGFVSGAEKYKRLSELCALFVPSLQENFGMIVPEALICGTPVYASTGTPWEELNTRKCGWWSNNNPETIADIIGKVMAMSDNELLDMGVNGRQLIEEKYSQSNVAEMMLDLYRWLVGKGCRPDYVFD